MKRLIGAAVILATFGFAAACDDDSPTEPSRETYTFTANLSPANEVPVVVNAEASGSGAATIVIDVTRNTSGQTTAASVSFQATLNGFPVNTALTMAHIHTGASGVAGPILINTGLMANEVTLVTGTGGFTKNSVAVTDPTQLATIDTIITNPAGFYFNVHSVLNGPGMARGQLVRQ